MERRPLAEVWWFPWFFVSSLIKIAEGSTNSIISGCCTVRENWSGKAVFGGADVNRDLCFSLWGVNAACVHLESIWSQKSTQAISQMLTGFFFESWLFNVKSWSCPWLSVNQQEFKNRHLVILLSLFKSQGIFKLTGVQYHSQCERIELCSCNYLDLRGYHCWTLIIYLNVKSGGADKRTCWSKWHGSFCLILVLVLRRQLNWNNSKDTEALGITAGFMYREEIGFLLLCFGFPDKGRMKFLLSSQVVFSHRQNYKCIISFSLQYGQNCWGEVRKY